VNSFRHDLDDRFFLEVAFSNENGRLTDFIVGLYVRQPSNPKLSSGVKVSSVRSWLVRNGFREMTPAEAGKSELVAMLRS